MYKNFFKKYLNNKNKQKNFHVNFGDYVKIISGKAKNKIGVILLINKKTQLVTIDTNYFQIKIQKNFKKIFREKQKNKLVQSGLLQIHISNIKLLNII